MTAPTSMPLTALTGRPLTGSRTGDDDLFTGLWARARRSLACVELPAFGLQLLLRTRPGWRSLPAVVIDEDRPQGTLLAANAAARALGVHPGQRYAHALGLCRELRAAVVPPPTIGAGVAHIVSILRDFSPHIEPSPEEPGVLWLDTSGLGSLYGSLSSWALAVTERLIGEGFTGFIATGFSRFGTYASAKSLAAQAGRGDDPLVHADRVRVVTSPSAERDLAEAVPLDYLRLPPRLRERLGLLSVRTLGELGQLPRQGLVRRFGPEVLELVARLTGEREAPLVPTPEAHRLLARRLLDYVEHDATRLLTQVEALLDELWPQLVRDDRRVAALTLTLGREGRRGHGGEAGGSVRETLLEDHHLRPAVPTRERPLLLDLVRLRLEAQRPAEAPVSPVPAVTREVGRRPAPSGFVLVAIELHDAAAEAEQGQIFSTQPLQPQPGARSSRDTAAAARALARIVAELGEGRVALIAPRDGHLPRTRQVLVALPPGPLRAPEPTPLSGAPPLIRRLHRVAQPMPPRPRDLKSGRNDGWPARLLAQGPIAEVSTPSIVSGGWWGGSGVTGGTRHEVHREYLYAETRRGDLIWIYYDRRRRRWLEEGEVG